MASSVFFEANQAHGAPQPRYLDSWKGGPCLKDIPECMCLSLGFEAVLKAGGVPVRPLRDVLRLEPALWPPGWSWSHLQGDLVMVRMWAAPNVTPPLPYFSCANSAKPLPSLSPRLFLCGIRLFKMYCKRLCRLSK